MTSAAPSYGTARAARTERRSSPTVSENRRNSTSVAWRSTTHTDQLNDVGASLPNALARKYPNTPTARPWYYVFPSTQRSADPEDGQTKRHHRSPSPTQRTVREATALSEARK